MSEEFIVNYFLGGGWAAGSKMADVLGREREDKDRGKLGGSVRDAAE
jgi:hypothetical protein